MVHGDMDETSSRPQRVYLLPVENFILLVSEEAECASTRERMVGATGFEIAFCLFLGFGWVWYLAELK